MNDLTKFLNRDSKPDLFKVDLHGIQLPSAGVKEQAELAADQSFKELINYTFPEEDLKEKVSQIGKVSYIGDGVCKISGIDNVRVEDVIKVKTSSGSEQALVLGVEEDSVETVVLGDYSKIKVDDHAIATNKRLSIPTGKSLLGRVINPLGDPLDGKGPIEGDETRDVEFPAPSVVSRENIYQPLHTGLMAIDTTVPVGKGQRELVIGDRKTGKSRTAIDIICNQKGQEVICVYVGIGIQAAKAKATVQLLQEREAMKFTTVVLALSDDSPSLQYIAPYVGAALCEHFMYQGKHCLIVYDDLSKQAKAYRQVSLLMKRSPGRDAYPGDIFFLHSRLLERAAKLDKKLGGGSMTALPIAETQSGDVSEYIITNLMSITDGHIYLDANMMHEGIIPAVNSGLSVSRIGGKVQTQLLKKVGELASRQLARYNEVKSFETMNTEVAEETVQEISRGKRVREIFAQESSLNLSEEEEVLLLAIATSGRMDQMPLSEVGSFETQFIQFFRELDNTEFKQLYERAKKLEEIESYLEMCLRLYLKKYPSMRDHLQLPDSNQENQPANEENTSLPTASPAPDNPPVQTGQPQKEEKTSQPENQTPPQTHQTETHQEKENQNREGTENQSNSQPESDDQKPEQEPPEKPPEKISPPAKKPVKSKTPKRKPTVNKK